MSNPLHGLVMCGGKSSRMGQDKSLLDYHGVAQRNYLFNILKDFCKEVYISCNANQYPTIPHSFNPLPDSPEFGDIGPMAGVLTAFSKLPKASFLVIGCDYPLLQKEDINLLIQTFENTNSTASYITLDNNIHEPLLAVYHNDISTKLINYFQLNEHSLRRVLEKEQAVKLPPHDPLTIRSIDSFDEYMLVKAKMKREA